MADPSTPAALRRSRGLAFLAALALLLVACPYSASGQETATVIEDAPTAEGAATGDVTDLGDVVGDTMAADHLTDLGPEGAAAEGTEGAADATIAKESAAAGDAAESATEATATDASSAAEQSADASAQTPASTDAEAQAKAAEEAAKAETKTEEAAAAPVVQSGPYIDLLGETLLSLEMVSETQAQVHQHYTNAALEGKKVVGLYFSADWCGPCRQFTPDLFEIVWISRCRDVDSFGQYFTHMNWLALPPNEAMGPRGQALGEKYKVKGIPSLVLLDEIGNVITLDGRNKIPMDKAGIGFPWRSPMSVLISTLVPRSFRLMAKSQFASVAGLVKKVLLGQGAKVKAAMQGGGGGGAGR
ncbi:hypothetical protein ACHAXT_006716 [Thalassiosira profunda]